MLEPKIYTTVEWGAEPAKTESSASPTPMLPSTWPRALGACIHHAVYPNRDPLPLELEREFAFTLARGLQADHMHNRKWADTGQHFTISRGGLILEGRHGTLKAAREGRVVKGAHAGDKEGNERWFGIELEGTYDKVFAVTPQQWDALIGLLAWLSFCGGYLPTSIRGHRDFKPTLCPGLVYQHLDELRAAVEKRRLE